MIPFVADPDFTLYVGDVREVLAELPDESVHCVVTSPPYWGLRDYGTGTWAGGDPDCAHVKQQARSPHERKSSTLGGGTDTIRVQEEANVYRVVCGECGARRVDQQLGLEPTAEAYIARMVDVFSEVRRVLRRDGTCWLNIGDSYAGGGGNYGSGLSVSAHATHPTAGKDKPSGVGNGVKPKDLVGIPWRVAFALQADGWYLRSDIIWAKPNPMPESVTDRPTKSHEYLFLLSKSARYFYDADAIREPYGDPGREWWNETTTTPANPNRNDGGGLQSRPAKGPDGRRKTGVLAGVGSIQHRDGERWPNLAGRNARSVWEIATQPYAEAHFATFPPELPRRCIAAGTSEHGCCPSCGAPWERRVIATGPDGRSAEIVGGKAYDEEGKPLMGDTMIDPGVRGSFNSGHTTLRRDTAGWKPTCDHGLPARPCVVLDPFMGSGTVALVARRLGRRSVGIELNPEYAQLAAKRLSQLSLLAEETA